MAAPSLYTPDFSIRSTAAEWLDDPSMQGEELLRNLDEIARINRALGGEKLVVKALRKMLRRYPSAAMLRIADLGCGSGDLPRAMVRWCRRQNLPVHITAVDINPAIVEYARICSEGFPEIEYRVADIRSAEFTAEKFDIVCCSLFLHHFPDAEIRSILHQSLQQATMGVLVNDLQRSRLAYSLFKILTFTLPVSAVTRHDGAVSICRGFRRTELEGYLPAGGHARAEVSWQWAFRWRMMIIKNSTNR